MNILIKTLIVLITWKFPLIRCDELVGVLVPKVAYKNKDFYTKVQVYDLDDYKTEVGIQFLKSNVTYELVPEGNKTINFKKRNFGPRNSTNLIMTLMREKKVRGNYIQQCNTQTREIKIEDKSFYIFIQFDKPVYKPDDEIHFRIIVVDKNLVPHQMNNIRVKIFDPYGREMQNYDDLGNQPVGLFMEKYALSNSVILGDWKMTVVVDKNYRYGISKIIPVQKYSLPLFNVKFETLRAVYLPNSKLIFTWSAKYSFGSFVTGNVVLDIFDTYDNRKYFTRTYNNVTDMMTVTLSFRKDLKVEIANRMNFMAKITFTEPETGIKVSKFVTFTVANTQSKVIKAEHSRTYTPGLPFNIKIFASTWDNKPVDSSEPIDINYQFIHKNGRITKATYRTGVKDSVASQEVIVGSDVVDFEIECRLSGSNVYRTRVERDKTIHARNFMKMDYELEQNSDYDMQYNIFVSSTFKMEKLLVAVMTSSGVIETKSIECDGQTVFKFPLQYKPSMMPHFTVEVYNVRDANVIEHGSLKIETKNMSSNFLDIKLSSSEVNARSKVSMTFNTLEESKIYILAIDNRLRFLKKDNDVSQKDIIKELSSYESQTELILDDMTSWHDCTPIEINRIVTGRQEKSAHSNDEFINGYDDIPIDDDDFGHFDNSDEESPPEVSEESSEEDLLREKFQEIWIFEAIEFKNEIVTKSYIVPDTITSWHISAFSMSDSGLAIANPLELTVKKEFFIQFNLPYSIRYKEVLKIDVLVFNYVKSNKELDVKLEIENENSKQFEFVHYNEVCNPTYSNKSKLIQTLKVPPLSMRKSSFYIRSNILDEIDKKNDVKIKTITIRAIGTDSDGYKKKDGLKKKLRIEAVGVRKYNVQSYSFILNGTKKEFQSEFNSEGNFYTSCIVSGDYISDAATLNSRFENNPTGSLEQATSILRGNVQLYRYFQTKKKQNIGKYIKNQYQAVLKARENEKNVSSSTGYIAYFLDTVIPAMELNLIHQDKITIEKEMDKLRQAQTDSGTFSLFGEIPKFDIKFKSDKVVQNRQNTAEYFQTAYILISMIKAQKFIDKNYTDVINKAFKYIDESSIKNMVDFEGRSIAAYVYAISNEKIKARGMLDDIDHGIVDFGENKICYKISINSQSCDMRHTAYVAMTFLKLNEIDKAMPLIYWMLKEFDFSSINGYTYNTAVLLEPIADAAILLNFETSNFQVTLNDNFGFKETIKYTNANVKERHEINFIPNTTHINISAVGTGYCSVTRVDKTINTNLKLSETLRIDINPDVVTKQSNERIVKVCAEFDSENSNYDSLKNVIYEVEFPTGYVYAGIKDEKKQQEFIKLIEERKGKTMIYIYYNDLEDFKNYCVEIKAAKSFDVSNPSPAVVKVYSFDNKDNVAVEFYSFKSSTVC